MKTIHTLALTTLAAAMAAGSAYAQQPPATPPTAHPPVEQAQPMPQTDPMQQTETLPPTPPPTDVGQPPGMEPRGHDMDKKPSYDELNTRADDRLTRDDLAAHPRLLEKFDDIDTAGDGVISRAEYDAWMSKKKDKKDHGDGASEY